MKKEDKIAFLLSQIRRLDELKDYIIEKKQEIHKEIEKLEKEQ